jgi:hypothetical protein
MKKVRLNSKWGFINQQNEEICPIKYDWVFDFYEGIAQVKLNGKFGYIDTNGKELCEIKYGFTELYSTRKLILRQLKIQKIKSKYNI